MGSAFASRSKKTITLGSGEEEFEAILQKLSGAALEKAARARQKFVAENTRAMGGEMMQTFAMINEAKKAADAAEGIKEPEPTLEQKRTARYNSYDRTMILELGIASWNAKTESGKELVCSPGNISDLCEEDAEKAFHELIDFSCPELDKEKAELAAAKS